MDQKCPLLLIAAAWFGIAGVTAAAESPAMEALQQAAQLERDPRTRAITKVSFRRDTVLDTAVVEATLSLPELQELDVSFTRPGASGYAWIGQVESLERLAMNGLNVTEEDLAFVAKLPKLVRLEIRQNRLSEAALRKLAAMPSIRELDVSEGPVQEGQLRQIEDEHPQVTFIRQWEIEVVDDRYRLRMNTPVADFLFEAWAAYPNYRRSYTVPISGAGKYRNTFRAGMKRDLLYESKINTKKDLCTVTTFFGGKFQLTGDGTQLVFKDATFDITGPNQTIFVSADEQGEFNQYRVENIFVLPNYLDGERLRSASLPLLKLHEDAKQPASKDVETEEPYDGYRGESTGLGYCTKWDCDFKGNFAFILWEWPDEVATLEEPLRLVRSGRGFSRGTHAVATLEEPLPPLWSQKPTGRGVTIVYEGVPSSGRSSREIAVCPVGGGATGEAMLCLGRSRNFAWPFAPRGLWHTSVSHVRGNDHFPLLELTYEKGVCRIKHTQLYLDLELLDRGRKLRCTQAFDPSTIPSLYEAIDPEERREALRNRKSRILLEREVIPISDRPLYIIDRDGNFRLEQESEG